jgi:hypothetical protein
MNYSNDIVKCRVCIEVEGKNKIFVLKWVSLCKHEGCQKAMRNMRSDVKKGTSFIPRFVSMLRTR